MFEGPWPCTSFVLCSLTMHEWHNHDVSIILLLLWAPLFVFCQVLCSVNPQNNQQKHTTKNLTKFPNYFPQLTMVRRAIHLQQSQQLNYAFTLSGLILRSQGLKRTPKQRAIFLFFWSFQRTGTRNGFKGCIRDVESEYEDLRERPLDLTFSEKEDVTRVFKNVKKCGCKDLECQNGGQCLSRLNDFRCECKLGFTGPQCGTESKCWSVQQKN